ncbi:ATP-binding cassette domain-containing protein [Sphingobacterium sp. SRCM116780]|uniref:ABC-F family ATP-binding cassette domain-containing protein n=1 Tax=Sphingobacterium sp. SRCM116780 TaxID=2907623 RepID=UPI001F254876|nr:ATP-binding cassette domain-containing protein [Sphingobacterium sp. SRCM116780]UIR57538.1 ATP-binding cassette domain-containing protein [Sphingobacterium sp. SRCM116780]
MLILQNISYKHPNKDVLFHDIHLSLQDNKKIALIGNNGVGKSILLKIIAGELTPASGQRSVTGTTYFVPQIFGQYNELSIAQALKIETKLVALHQILSGIATEDNLTALDDDWNIEERCQEALHYWQLSDLDLEQKLGTLSGGQKTKVFLAGISIHQPRIVLLDEPSNQLDSISRTLLYQFIRSTSSSIIVVSHDRYLLNQLDSIYELSSSGLMYYNGNYDFYLEEKKLRHDTLQLDLKHKEKELRKIKTKARETLERQQKLDARGKGKQQKEGVSRIMMNTLRNNAEKSTAKLKDTHAEKTASITQELLSLRHEIPDIDKIKFGLTDSTLHTGKTLFKINNLNISYDNQPLWQENLNLQITSAERVALKGKNGSGKTTFIQILLNKLANFTGEVYRSENKAVYIDQDYSMVNNALSIYDQVQEFNDTGLQEHEIKIRLNRFLFSKDTWDKPCSILSGGEKMRLCLCCLTIHQRTPDIIVMDEPTNNLDIQNIEILTAALKEYQGTLLIVSHDDYFLNEINIGRTIML